jgi:hypothetical protein
MRYQDDVRLSLPTREEAEALQAPLSLDASATFENASLARALVNEAAAQWYIGSTARCLAGSPLWRFMCEELFALRQDETAFRTLFLVHSARLMFAGQAQAEGE